MQQVILMRVAMPLGFLGATVALGCFAGLWVLNRSQADLSGILTQNVTSLEAAAQLEANVLRLRFAWYRALRDGVAVDSSQVEDIRQATGSVRQSIRQARKFAFSQPEQQSVAEIERAFQNYELAYANLRKGSGASRLEYQSLVEERTVASLLDPCAGYVRLNKEQIETTQKNADQFGSRLMLALLGLGLGGPIGGVLLGWSVTRGLNRSIHLLQVQVRDLAHHFDQDVASVKFLPGRDFSALETQLTYILTRVRETIAQVQRQQQELVRAQQLAAVGQLAASVAHEIRNPLMSIKLLVDVAVRNKNPRPFTPENLAVVQKEILRLEQTVQEFLDFARPPALQRTHQDLRMLVHEAIGLIQARAQQQRICVIAECPTSPAVASADRGKLVTVLVNLLLNALDAMPEGGTVSVRLAVENDREVFLSVDDTGSGIPASVNDSLFTPFLSTKPTGTGLGLCISRRIVEEHGGTITGMNRPEGGARFSLTLPLEPSGTPHAHPVGR